MNIVDKYSEELMKNEPISYAGLVLHPLKVKEYALYRIGQDSFELMQASLSPKLARLSWFPCLDALDREIKEQTGKPGIYMPCAVKVMEAALNLDPGSKFSAARNSQGNISAVMIQKDAGSQPVLLNMQQMRDVREIIAAQNGYEIPDEGWTLELYRAQKQLQKTGDAGLKFDLEELLYSVAVNTGENAEDIWEWSIKRFQLMQKAISRKLGYMICTTAEIAAQVKFTNGNPYPDWRLPRAADRPKGFRTLAQIEGTGGAILNSPEIQ